MARVKGVTQNTGRAKKVGSRFDYSSTAEVVSLAEESIPRKSGIHWERDHAGRAASVILTWPTPNAIKPVQVVDLSYWLEFPMLAEPIAEAFLAWGADKKPKSRVSIAGSIRTGFFAFLKATAGDTDLRLENLTRSLVNEFKAWIKLQPIRPGTQYHCIAALRYMVEHLQLNPKWASTLPSDLHVQNIYGISRLKKPTPAIDTPNFEAIKKAAQTEMLALMQQLEHWWDEVPKALSASRCDYNDAAKLRESVVLTLAALEKCGASELYTQREFKKVAANRLRHAIEDCHGGHGRLRLYRFPTTRALVPFVLMLAAPTGYNTSTLLNMRLSDIDVVDSLTGPRMRLSPYKGRSDAPQPKSFRLDDPRPFAVHKIINFLIRWTERARLIAVPEIRGRLFLMAPKHAGKVEMRKITTYENSISLWYPCLKAFLADHGLVDITLAQVRKTMEGFVNTLYGGDIKARQVFAVHKSSQTTHDSYTTSENRQFYAEQLAKVQGAHQRWLGTDGRVDPREDKADIVGAATPGFGCYDPFDSPIAGEVQGRLCQAYGACTGCDLSFVNARDPYSLARLLQLGEAMVAAQATLPPMRWIEAWRPRLGLLREKWLSHFTDTAVLDAASRITLPPLPPLE